MKNRVQFPLAVFVLLFAGHALAQGTAFTYQGRLNDGAGPANGLYDFQFTIYDSSSSGLAIGQPLTNAPTAVSNGLFTVALDFGGNIFTGPARWLGVALRTNGGAGAYQSLTPRQSITAAPYAVAAGSVTGVLPSTSLSGSYPGAVSLSNPANVFAGNGAGLTSLNAGNLSGTIPVAALGNAWQTGGNTGANPTNNIFLGSVDNLPVEIHVNGGRAFRLEPNTNGAANIIGGWSNNFVYATASQAVIGGGGGLSAVSPSVYTNIVSDSYGTVAGGLGNIAGNTNADPTDARGASVGGGSANQAAGLFSTIAGGQNNFVQLDYGFIGGGQNNTNLEYDSVIGGGQNNLILSLADHAFIGGGFFNTIAGSAGPVYSVIAGGANNTIQSNVSYSVIGGGIQNIVGAGAINATIAGGQDNVVISPNSTISGGEINITSTNSYFATISGGGYNGIGTNSSSSTISGGYSNIITNNTLDSAIGGGSYNQIGDSSPYSTIAGGRFNSIGNNATAAAIGGGYVNLIDSSAFYSVIPGGFNNSVIGAYSMAAGYQAQAFHNGTFVWSDPGTNSFASTDTNQFLIRAVGGVGINTNAPSGAALNVAGTVRATSFQGDGSGLVNVNAGALGNYVYAFNSGAQVVALGNTFQDLNFTTDSQISGWTHTSGTSQYASTQTGLYLVQYYGQFTTTAANGTNAQMRVELNGAEVPGSRSAATVSALNQFVDVSKAVIVNANTADVLTLQFTGSGTGIRLSGTGNSTLTVTRIQ